MTPYGCHNTERRDGYFANAGYNDGGSIGRVQQATMTRVWIDDVSSRACQYRKGTPNDVRCEGCLK